MGTLTVCLATHPTFPAWWAAVVEPRLRADLSPEWREAVRTLCYLAWEAGRGAPIPVPDSVPRPPVKET